MVTPREQLPGQRVDKRALQMRADAPATHAKVLGGTGEQLAPDRVGEVQLQLVFGTQPFAHVGEEDVEDFLGGGGVDEVEDDDVVAEPVEQLRPVQLGREV